MGDIQFLEFREKCIIRINTNIGSPEYSEHDIWLLEDGVFTRGKIKTSLALQKLVDEILVNAIDQYNRKGTNVRNIWISYNAQSGEITIKNDGRGIKAERVKKIGDRYNIEGIISVENSGTNFNDEGDPDRVTGGINGVGMKVVNVGSKKFTFTTVCNGEKYTQTCEDNMDPKKIGTPTITKVKDTDWTEVKFIPDVKLVAKNHDSDVLTELSKYITMRAYQTAMALALINYRYDKDERISYGAKPVIWLNGKELRINTTDQIAKLFGIKKYLYVNMESSSGDIRFPWYVMIADKEDGDLPNMSILNGVYLENGGNHVDMIMKAIVTICNRVEPDLDLDLAKFKAKNNLFIFNVLQIPIPDFTGGNTKSSIDIAVKKQNEMAKTYGLKIMTRKGENIEDTVCFHNKATDDKIAKMMKEAIKIWKKLNDFKNQDKNIKGIKVRKHEKAEKYGSLVSTLIIPEGDSAALCINRILTDKTKEKDPKLNRSYYGTYNIQGVPPNSCKETEAIKDENNRIRLYQSDMLQKNVALQGLYKILGLDYNYDYDWKKEPKGRDIDRIKANDVAFSKLKYGRIILATDQDLDGIGNICSLILVYFIRFFPGLIKRGYIYRLQTPVIRVYGDKTIGEFYSEKDYLRWVVEKFGSEKDLPPKYKVHYKKGLSGHSTKEVANMAKTFNKNLVRILWDGEAIQTMIKYYGDDSNVRKVILNAAIVTDYPAEFKEKLQVSASNHFIIESTAFQLEF